MGASAGGISSCSDTNVAHPPSQSCITLDVADPLPLVGLAPTITYPGMSQFAAPETPCDASNASAELISGKGGSVRADAIERR